METKKNADIFNKKSDFSLNSILISKFKKHLSMLVQQTDL